MVAEALQSLRPGAQWVLRGDQLEWLDINQTQPTQEEIDAEILVLEAKQVQSELENVVQKRLDDTAKANNWDDMKSARACAGIPLDGTETVTEKAMYDDAVRLAKLYLKAWGYAIDEFAKLSLPDTDVDYRTIPTLDEWKLELTNQGF